QEVYHAVFSPDGARLATLTIAGDVRLWSAETGEPITPPIPHPHSENRGRLSFSPEGKRLLVATGSNMVWLRDFSPERSSLAELTQRAQVLSGRRLEPSGGVTALDSASLSHAWERLRASPAKR